MRTLDYERFPESFMFRSRGIRACSPEAQKQIKNTISNFIKNAENGQVYEAGVGFGGTGTPKFRVTERGNGELYLAWISSGYSKPVKMTRKTVGEYIFNGATLIEDNSDETNESMRRHTKKLRIKEYD